MDVDPESVNVLVVGDCNSGKTSFLSRLRGEKSNLIYIPSTEIETKYYFEYISIKRKKERRYFHFFNIPGDFSKIDEYRTSFLDKDFVLIVLPAGKYVDFGGIKKALKAKKVSMASEKDITKYLKTKVGLLHPFGSEYNLQTLLDKGMLKAKKMIASAGTYTHSIEISLKDFEKITQPIKGSFSKSKK
jgi:GTPase SAR1 family protein